MDYREQAESLLYDAKNWAGDPHIRKDLYGAAQSITDLLARTEAAEEEVPAMRKELWGEKTQRKFAELAWQVSSEHSIMWEGRAQEAKCRAEAAEARAEKAERERDAAIKELDGVASVVDNLADFIDEQVYPFAPYSVYEALRENADAISMWQYETEWRGQKEE